MRCDNRTGVAIKQKILLTNDSTLLSAEFDDNNDDGNIVVVVMMVDGMQADEIFCINYQRLGDKVASIRPFL